MSGLSGAAPQVYRYFLQRYGPIVAAGIDGNTQQESSNRPDAEGGGLIQGQGGRTSSGTLAQQLAGVDRELRGPEHATLVALEHAKGPREAARIFSERFERPGEPRLENRERYAQEALQQLGRGAPLPAAAAGSVGGGSTVDPGASASSAAGLVALIEALKGPPQSSVQGVALRKPTEQGEPGGIRLPQQIGQPSKTSPSQLLDLVSALQGPATPAPEQAAEPAAPAAAAGTGPMAKGVAEFGGKQVASWIAPILQYARSKGWKGGVTSGYRSYAEQKRIYDSGVRPAAVPGTSNHEGTEYPRGAVDVTNAEELARVLQGSPYAKQLQYAGSKDPVHFSHPHNGSY